MKLRLLIMALLTLFAVSCGDSALEGVADDNSGSAETEALQIALDERDFDYVINRLANVSADDYTATPAQDDYEHLSISKRKMLASAWLGKSGFVATDSLEMMMGDNDDEIVKFLVSAQTDSDNISGASVAGKLTYYKQIIGMYNNNVANKDDSSLVTAAGFASAMYTVMATLGGISDAIGSSFSIEDLENGTVTFNSGDIIEFVPDIITNAQPDLIFDMVDSLIKDADTKEKFLDFWEDLTGSRVKGGTIDATKLETTIKDGLGI